MTPKLQITIDCHDTDLLARFWCLALGYVPQPPPEGFATMDDFWRSVGVPEDELDGRIDSIVDPDGAGPRVWFQQVPESKAGKNRVHLDLTVSGGRGVALELRRARVDAEAARLEAAGATRVAVGYTEGVNHYGITLRDPEGNEFCLN